MNILHRPGHQHGFTLTELTIVLLIVTLLLGGLLMPLSAQEELRKIRETQTTLDLAREALYGFALLNERLPCPASSTSNGLESFCTSFSGPCGPELVTIQTHGRCNSALNGFVPAAQLGIGPTDANGYLLDAFGGRVRYAVDQTQINGVDFPITRPQGIKTAASEEFSDAILLKVCSDYQCTASTTLTTKAPAILLSLGPNWGRGGNSNDEAENLDADANFVNHPPTPADNSTPTQEFDDQTVWLSLPVLLGKLYSAGRLP